MKIVHWVFTLLLACSSAVWAADFSAMLAEKSARAGVCVVLGADSADALLSARVDGKYVVQGLCTDAAQVQTIRDQLVGAGAYGPVSVEQFNGTRLPYIENLVNVVLVLDQGQVERDEIMRIVAPYGMALVKSGGKWVSVEKPYPAEMDEWSQPNYNASGSRVSQDQEVGPPTRLQWLDQEIYDRKQLIETLSAGGRNFYIFKDGLVVARDAFNGARLWEQQNVGVVGAATQDFLCALIGGKLAWVDASTGEVHQTEAKMNGLFAWESGVAYSANEAYDLKTESFLWQSADPIKTLVYAPPIVADGCVVFSTNPRRPDPVTICRDANTGEELWQVPYMGELGFAYKGKLLIAGPQKDGTYMARGKERKIHIAVNHCLDVKTGKTVWTIEFNLPDHHGASTMFPVGDEIWVRPRDTEKPGYAQGEFWRSYDLKTGGIIKEVPAIQNMHRCFDPKATERFLIGTGVDYLNVEDAHTYSFRGSRGGCGTGPLPANGMLYAFPNMCMCMGQVNGVSGVSSHSLTDPSESQLQLSTVFEKGPAYGSIQAVAQPSPDTWWTLRGNNTRRGSNQAKVPNQLRVLWEKQNTVQPSSPVAVGSAVCVALRDINTVSAFSAADGKPYWSFIAGGSVDSPPTLSGNAVVFGCEDGWVYVLRAADGMLAWRFRAAPKMRTILTNGRLASAWPLHGSLVVEQGVVYATAGHHNELDGGLFSYALELESGKIVWEKRLIKDGVTPEDAKSEEGHTGNNIQASDGETLYLELIFLDLKTAEIQKKFELGKSFFSGGYPDAVVWGGPQGYLLDLSLPQYTSGHSSSNWIWDKVRSNMIAVEDELAYGILMLHPKDRRHHLKAPLFDTLPSIVFCAKQVVDGKKGWSDFIVKESLVWRTDLPEGMIGNAVVKVAGKVLVVCRNEDGSEGGLLLQLDSRTGAELGRLELADTPRWDGLAVSGDRLYLVTEDNKLLCIGGK